MILAIFDLQVTPMLPTKFRVNWPFGSGEEAKIDFQDGGHFGFPIRMILAIFDLQVTLMLPIKFRVNCLFVCVEVLRPSQPNGVMSSAVSLPNHTFTGQA